MNALIDIDLSVAQLLDSLGKLGLAFLLAIPIAWERETSTRRLGLRTFPLVSMASCAFVLVSSQQLGEFSDAQARVVQGVITGIGVIGGGAILKQGSAVTGTATAAGIWATGAIGAAVAFGHLEVGLALALAAFLTLRLLSPLKAELDKTC